MHKFRFGLFKKITAACPRGYATVPYVSVMCYE